MKLITNLQRLGVLGLNPRFKPNPVCEIESRWDSNLDSTIVKLQTICTLNHRVTKTHSWIKCSKRTSKPCSRFAKSFNARRPCTTSWYTKRWVWPSILIIFTSFRMSSCPRRRTVPWASFIRFSKVRKMSSGTSKSPPWKFHNGRSSPSLTCGFRSKTSRNSSITYPILGALKAIANPRRSFLLTAFYHVFGLAQGRRDGLLIATACSQGSA